MNTIQNFLRVADTFLAYMANRHMLPTPKFDPCSPCWLGLNGLPVPISTMSRQHRHAAAAVVKRADQRYFNYEEWRSGRAQFRVMAYTHLVGTCGLY